MSKEKKFRTSAMKGRRISLEDRGPNAKKLGRKFKFEEGAGERVVASLMLRKGTMKKLLGLPKNKGKKKAAIIAELIEKELE